MRWTLLAAVALLGCSPPPRFVAWPSLDPRFQTVLLVAASAPGPGPRAQRFSPDSVLELDRVEARSPVSLLLYEEPFDALDLDPALVPEASGTPLPRPAQALQLTEGDAGFGPAAEPSLGLVLGQRYRPAPCHALVGAPVGDGASTTSAQVFGRFGDEALGLRETKDGQAEVWRLGPGGVAKIYVTTATDAPTAAALGAGDTLLLATTRGVVRLDGRGTEQSRIQPSAGIERIWEEPGGALILRSFRGALLAVSPAAPSTFVSLLDGLPKPSGCSAVGFAAFGATESGALLSADFSGRIVRVAQGMVLSQETVVAEPICASAYARRTSGEELISLGKLSERAFSTTSILARENGVWQTVLSAQELHLARLMTLGELSYVIGQNVVYELVIRRAGGERSVRLCPALELRGVFSGVGTPSGLLVTASPSDADELYWLTLGAR